MTLVQLPPARDVWDGFGEHELASYASAIAFRVLFAAIPFVLFVLAVLGLLSLNGVWTKDVAPEIAPNVSDPVFMVLDSTVRKVLSGGQPFWLTVGLALTVWSTGSAIRPAIRALDRVYGCDRPRGWRETIPLSLRLGVAIGACVLGALAALRFAPLLLGGHGALVGLVFGVARYAVAVALLLLAVGLLVSYGSATHQPLRWVSFGSACVVVGWLVTWSAFAVYLTEIASYGSVYGAFASLVVLLTFLTISANVLLGGVLVDALVRERSQAAGGGPDRSRDGG